MKNIAVSFTPNLPELREKAYILGTQLPFFTVELERFTGEMLLLYTPDGLGLYEFQGKKRRLKEVLRVDFLSARTIWRLAHDNTIKQPLARAAGIRAGFRPHIFDASAGLGQDAFVLASLGCSVTLCERSPLPAALLADGMARALQSREEIGNIVRERMQLLTGESERVLRQECAAGRDFDTVYFDPMYPHTSSSAANKKSMRLIRSFVGDDDDSTRFMTTVETLKLERIAIKRPSDAPLISELQPHHVVRGKSCRYDIYLPRMQKM
ncbi:MAG: class I SAM-dependent methyltransferase [Desulforhopalus sp.]|nr:class I SAM-dependent methyltransferase [Desulforhopalus sp.]